MGKNRVRFILKNGAEFVVKCDKLTVVTDNYSGEITRIKWEGLTENNPLFVRFGDISAVIQENVEVENDDIQLQRPIQAD